MTTPRRDAFVIWIDGPTEPEAAEPLQGRIEHVQSSARAAFASVEELLGFLERHRSRGDGSDGSA